MRRFRPAVAGRRSAAVLSVVRLLTPVLQDRVEPGFGSLFDFILPVRQDVASGSGSEHVRDSARVGDLCLGACVDALAAALSAASRRRTPSGLPRSAASSAQASMPKTAANGWATCSNWLQAKASGRWLTKRAAPCLSFAFERTPRPSVERTERVVLRVTLRRRSVRCDFIFGASQTLRSAQGDSFEPPNYKCTFFLRFESHYSVAFYHRSDAGGLSGAHERQRAAL